ncbi:UDP-2,3-diacylglucosamine hydrolase [compost metagenome]
MHGNRDFLIGRRFCRVAGCTLLREGCVIDLYGEPVLLLHGDSLCTRDESYQRLRKRLRNPVSLWLLRNLPLATRHKLARKLRDASRMRTREKAAEIIDVTPEVVPQIMAERDVRTLIHGHTHRPAVHKLLVDGQHGQRIVLGDWDQQGWALEVDAQGYHLAPFPLS